MKQMLRPNQNLKKKQETSKIKREEIEEEHKITPAEW